MRASAPSLSPPLHEREADLHGLRYLYRLIDIADLGLDAEAAGDLVRAARQLGYTGLNITHPCKQTVIKHLDELSPDAAMLGAVNTVVFDGDRAIGHNTDWTGFARSFTRGLPDASTRRIVQLGAGGAGAAVAHALLTPAPTASPSSTSSPAGRPPWPPSWRTGSAPDAPGPRPRPSWPGCCPTRTAWST